MKLNKHQCLSIFYILLGIALAYAASKIKFMFSVANEDVGPKFFPYCCASGLVICGFGKLLSSKNKEGKVFVKDLEGWLRLLLILAVFIVYLLAIKYMGFIISSMAMVVALTYMLSGKENLVFWKVAVFAVVMTLVTYFIFVKLINVMLPTGKWVKALLRALR